MVLPCCRILYLYCNDLFPCLCLCWGYLYHETTLHSSPWKMWQMMEQPVADQKQLPWPAADCHQTEAGLTTEHTGWAGRRKILVNCWDSELHEDQLPELQSCSWKFETFDHLYHYMLGTWTCILMTNMTLYVHVLSTLALCPKSLKMKVLVF